MKNVSRTALSLLISAAALAVGVALFALCEYAARYFFPVPLGMVEKVGDNVFRDALEALGFVPLILSALVIFALFQPNTTEVKQTES